jgi:hypothetical protein
MPTKLLRMKVRYKLLEMCIWYTFSVTLLCSLLTRAFAHQNPGSDNCFVGKHFSFLQFWMQLSRSSNFLVSVLFPVCSAFHEVLFLSCFVTFVSNTRICLHHLSRGPFRRRTRREVSITCCLHAMLSITFQSNSFFYVHNMSTVHVLQWIRHFHTEYTVFSEYFAIPLHKPSRAKTILMECRCQDSWWGQLLLSLMALTACCEWRNIVTEHTVYSKDYLAMIDNN